MRTPDSPEAVVVLVFDDNHQAHTFIEALKQGEVAYNDHPEMGSTWKENYEHLTSDPGRSRSGYQHVSAFRFDEYRKSDQWPR